MSRAAWGLQILLDNLYHLFIEGWYAGKGRDLGPPASQLLSPPNPVGARHPARGGPWAGSHHPAYLVPVSSSLLTGGRADWELGKGSRCCWLRAAMAGRAVTPGLHKSAS